MPSPEGTPLHVLILGDPMDPMVLQWRDYCQRADVGVSLFLDMDQTPLDAGDGPFTVLLNTHVDIPFFHLQHLPDVLYHAMAEDCLILNNALAETPTSTAAELNDLDNIVGFSALGLYSGTPVLEIAPASQTHPVYLQKTHQFLGRLGLRAIQVPDTPGLFLGRIVAMLVNEASSALMENVASAKDIDTAMRLGTNYPHGPLAWGDMIGLDVILAILLHLQDEYGDERYCPTQRLKHMVNAGKLGRKTGEGFYAYHPESLPHSSL